MGLRTLICSADQRFSFFAKASGESIVYGEKQISVRESHPAKA